MFFAAAFAASLAFGPACAQPLLETRAAQPALLKHLAPLALQFAHSSVALTEGPAPTFKVMRRLNFLLELGLRFADAGDAETAKGIAQEIAAIGARAPAIESDYESEPKDGQVRVATGVEAALAALYDRLGDKAESEAHLARIPLTMAPAPDDVYSDDLVEALSTMHDYDALRAKVKAWVSVTKGVRSAAAPDELLMKRAVWLAVRGDANTAVTLMENAPARASEPFDVTRLTAPDALRTLAYVAKWASLHGQDDAVHALEPRAVAIAAGPGVADPHAANSPFGGIADRFIGDEWGPALVAAGDPDAARALFDRDLKGQAPFSPGQDGEPECDFYPDDKIALPAALRDDYRAVTARLYGALGKSYSACVDPAGAQAAAMDARLETLSFVAPRKLAQEIDKGALTGTMSSYRTDGLEVLSAAQFASLVHDLDAGRTTALDALATPSSDGAVLLWAVSFATGTYRPELREMGFAPVLGFHTGL